MKSIIYNIVIILFLISITACEDFLSKDDPLALGVEEAYQSTQGINSIVANLASRIRYEQDFMFGGSFYGSGINSSLNLDMARWDESIFNHPSEWQHPGGNQNASYRQYYDFGLIRDINMHIENLKSYASLGEDQLKYLLAEARYYRAYTYFQMVFRLGGVPIIEEVYDYSNDPLQYALPRNTEEEVYDYVLTELDAIADDFGDSNLSLTRPTKGTALALKCRVALYAGTIAHNDAKNSAKGLKLPSGAVGLPYSKAEIYLQKCLDAYEELENLNRYSLYENNSDYAENFYELFTKKAGNSELIFIKDYEGNNFPNTFTQENIPRSLAVQERAGLQNPLLNLVESFEDITSRLAIPLDAYVGAEQVENMGENSSGFSYKIYDSPEEIFEGRDPRLSGTILYPGSTFRDKELDLQAGLAIKTATGYNFEHVDAIANVNGPTNLYMGIRKTGVDGPHRLSGYSSHTGFYLRKFMDPASGSEAGGQSTIAYPIFRYGEVLLNAAEAAWYLDQEDLSLELLNRIRNRAGGPEFELTSSELSLKKIMDERRVELAFEDHRFNDLKRWRIADEVWSNQRTNPTAVTYALWPYKIYAPDSPEEDGKWLFRKLLVERRGQDNNKGMPINFGLNMYYAIYPQTDGNPLIEPNPYH